MKMLLTSAGMTNASITREIEAAEIPVPSYAIDDQTAIKVMDAGIEVISEGNWKLSTGRRHAGTQ
jgi:hypothetical protein